MQYIKQNKYLGQIIIGITFLISIIFYHSSPSQYISDDSIFYLIIAQNIVDSSFSSFNGYIETNGYHPLWMVFNIISIKISSFLNMEPLIIIGLIYQLFLAGSIYLIFKIENILKIYSAPITSIILIFLFVSNGALHNMESSLALFFVLYTLYYILVNNNPQTKNFFNFGVLLGLIILSRLDLIFFGLIIAFYILVKYRKNFILSPKQFLYFVSGGLIMVVPYFIYNELTFGGITPISGALKSTFPNIEFSLRNISPYGLISSFFALIAVIIAITTKSKKIKFLFMTLALSSIIHAIYLVMFQYAMTWYYITGFLIMALVIGYVIRKINIKPISYFLLLLLVLSTVATSYIKGISDYTLSNHLLRGKTLNFSHESQMKRFSEILKEKLPINASIFTWDVPGFLAYYGKFKVFSADGLITNKVYQKELLEQGAIKIFKKYKINYILVPLTKGKAYYYDGMLFQPLKNDKYLITIYSRLYHKKVGTLQLSKENILFKIQAPYSGTDSNSPLIGIFKIPISNEANIWINYENKM